MTCPLTRTVILFALLAALVSTGAGCSRKGPEQIIVAIDADEMLAAHLTRIEVKTYDPEHAKAGGRHSYDLGGSESLEPVDLPFSFAITKNAADSFLLIVSGYEDQEQIVERKVRVNFRGGGVQALGVFLSWSCYGVICGGEEDDDYLATTCQPRRGCGGIEEQTTEAIERGDEFGLLDGGRAEADAGFDATTSRAPAEPTPPITDAVVPGTDAMGPSMDGMTPSVDASAPGEETCADDCSDPFPCTDDSCFMGSCIHMPHEGPRECDGVACTVGDSCAAGVCKPGKGNDALCSDDGNPCTSERCELSGCTRVDADGASCDDHLACTTADKCSGNICRGMDSCGSGAGICSAATGVCAACSGAADCDDRDPCTSDSCSAGACQHSNNTAACNDGKACTTNDVCSNRVCAGTSICPADATCGGSTCKCIDPSKAMCSNTCVVLATSNEHCGQCGRVCTDASCQNSACKPSAAAACTAYRYGGHDYLLCAEALSWPSARDRCRSYGFGLATIDNHAENDFLRTRPNAIERWIGANDRGSNGKDCRRDEEEGAWYWSDPLGAGNENFRLFCAFADRNAMICTASNGAYQNWRTGEPNNDGCDSCVIGDCAEGEDCGVFNADGTWNDGACNNALGFICESS